MALTINRQNEIRQAELNFIKRRFKQSTCSKAINECIKFVVYESSVLEKENKKMKKQLKIASRKNKALLKKLNQYNLS